MSAATVSCVHSYSYQSLGPRSRPTTSPSPYADWLNNVLAMVDTAIRDAQEAATCRDSPSSTGLEVVHQEYKETSTHDIDQRDHRETISQAIRRRPKVFLWILYALWVLTASSYDSQAGGVVVGIPRFRKDFGHRFEGGYVLPAKWLSAYSGGPVAS